MPDWFYCTLAKPLLSRLSGDRARRLALNTLGVVCRLPFGRHLIDLLGHGEADARLRRTVLGVRFPAPVGIGPALDTEAVALPALARFGIGFLEMYPMPPSDVASVLPQLLAVKGQGVRVIVHAVIDVESLREVADLIVLHCTPDSWPRLISSAGEVPVLLWQSDDTPETVTQALALGIRGIAVDGSRPALVATLRQRWPELPLLASGGIEEPEHALDLLHAGADLVSADAGLLVTGPELPRRCNDAVLYAESRPRPRRSRTPAPRRAWFWTLLLALGMLVGSGLALLIAVTRVVLPYDETFVGLSKAQLHAVNPRLLAFLTHDRVSLAGTMLAVGVLYLGLSVWGVRHGQRWARTTIVASACVGFATFFLFLAYGYLDPFHAFVTAVLFQFLLMALPASLGKPAVPRAPVLRGDWRWRLGLLGQLLLVVHALGVLGAGVVIGGFGVSRVFVHTDLEFMRTTREALEAANPYLLPLIAHDRASFGGNLVSLGLALLLIALWGVRPAAAWLWWTLLVAVAPAYAATLVVHFAVGYTDFLHLTPAYAGSLLFGLALTLTYPYLCLDGAFPCEWDRHRREPAR